MTPRVVACNQINDTFWISAEAIVVLASCIFVLQQWNLLLKTDIWLKCKTAKVMELHTCVECFLNKWNVNWGKNSDKGQWRHWGNKGAHRPGWHHPGGHTIEV